MTIPFSVEELNDKAIIGAWLPIECASFEFGWFVGALRTLLGRRVPYNREAVETLLRRGDVRVQGLLWPNRLRGMAAWEGPARTPPPDALRAAYARSWAAVESYRRWPQDFARIRQLLDVAAAGSA